MVLCSILLALDIIFTRFFSITVFATLRISFAFIVHTILAMIVPPIYTMLFMGLADVLGMMIYSAGQPLIIGLTVSVMVRGALMGLILYKRNATLPVIFTAFAVTTLVCDLALTPYFLSIAFGKGYLALMAVRAPASLINLFIKTFSTYSVTRLLSRYISKQRLE